jgi:hypothetical protein
MPDFTPKAFRIPRCIDEDMRRVFEPLLELIRHMLAGDEIQINVDQIGGENNTELHDAANLTGILSNPVLASFVTIGELDGPLVRDGTATLNIIGGGTQAVSGHFVPVNMQAPAGARCLGLRWGNTWYAIVIDQCVELAA